MHSVFDDVLDLYVTVYLDNVLVFSRTIEEHELHLREVWSRLKAHGLKAHRYKCYSGVDTRGFHGSLGQLTFNGN